MDNKPVNRRLIFPYTNVRDGDELYRYGFKFRYVEKAKEWSIVVEDIWETMALDFEDTQPLMFPVIVEPNEEAPPTFDAPEWLGREVLWHVS